MTTTKTTKMICSKCCWNMINLQGVGVQRCRQLTCHINCRQQKPPKPNNVTQSARGAQFNRDYANTVNAVTINNASYYQAKGLGLGVKYSLLVRCIIKCKWCLNDTTRRTCYIKWSVGNTTCLAEKSSGLSVRTVRLRMAGDPRIKAATGEPGLY